MSFIETIFDRLAAFPDKELVVEMHGARAVGTRGDALASMIASARGQMRARGVARGDRVILLAPNSARWVAADVAILAEGAISVPLYVRQAPKELASMMRDADPRLVLVVDEGMAAALRAEWPEAPILLFDSLFDAASSSPVREAPLAREVNEVVTLVYTSGTSGDAKGAMLTRANADFMLPLTRDAIKDMMGERVGDDRVFHYLPFCFAGSRIVLWTCLVRGNPITMSTDLAQLQVELKAADPHYFLNVPALLERIRAGVEKKIAERGGFGQALYTRGVGAHRRIASGEATLGDRAVLSLAQRVVFAKIRAQIGAKLECLICGSAPLGEEVQRWFEMIGLPVYQVYGLTETTAIVTMDKPRAAKAGWVGHVVPGCEVKLGEGDELLVRGPNIFAGYWRRPDETRAVLDGEWLKTGDQGELDASGNLRVVGRVKNILVPTSGHNVAPEPIEQRILERVPGATHAVVVGHGKPFLTAIVAGTSEREAVQRALDEINETMPHYRRLRGFHLTPEPFTPESGLLTANQKLKRRAIEAHYRSELEALYT